MKISDWNDDNFTIPVPSVEEVQAMYDPPPADFYEGGKGEIVAVGGASYLGPDVDADNSVHNMLLTAAWDLGPGNLWVLPRKSRLPYPFAPLYSLASLFKTEAMAKKKADWFLWLDDDVVVPKHLIRDLRASAHPEDRPFVAAVGHDRYPPFRAAVWQPVKYGEVTARKQWVPWVPSSSEEMAMPTSGVHKVDTTGLCAALFHRSFFDRVPQPWFAAIPPRIEDDGNVGSRANPDSWLCQQCQDCGMPVYVDCDVQIIHVGLPMPVHTGSAAILRSVFRGPNQCT